MDSDAREHQLREATAQDLLAWRGGFPEKFRPQSRYIAGPEGQARAMGGLEFRPSREFPESALFWICTRPDALRQGWGSSLLHHLTEEARAGKAPLLRVARPLDEGSAGALFLEHHGFTVRSRFHSWESETQALDDLCRPAGARLRERGKLPAEARVVSLAEAPLKEVAALVADNMGFASPAVAGRLEPGEHGYSRSFSVVALLRDRVVGATLVTYQKAHVTTEANAVAAGFRQSWVHVALKAGLAERMLRRGVAKMRFGCNPVLHRDTEKMARRLGARLLSARCEYELAL